MSWYSKAACLGADHRLFFSDAEEKVAEALEICAGCPVTDECFQDAIDYGDTMGVRGGVKFNDRGKPRKSAVGRPRLMPEAYSQCGTDPGYQTHIRNKEKPCRACKEAHRVAVNEWRADRRRRGAA